MTTPKDSVRKEGSIREAAEALAKHLEWERAQPLGLLVHLRQTHIMRGEGDGPTIYFGRHRGAGFIGVDVRGFCGWRGYPTWMPGGWEFTNPRVMVGRLYSDGETRIWSCEIIVPAKLYRAWRWLTSPASRNAIHR
jgi:hypothetical protein